MLVSEGMGEGGRGGEGGREKGEVKGGCKGKEKEEVELLGKQKSALSG